MVCLPSTQPCGHAIDGRISLLYRWRGNSTSHARLTLLDGVESCRQPLCCRNLDKQCVCVCVCVCVNDSLHQDCRKSPPFTWCSLVVRSWSSVAETLRVGQASRQVPLKCSFKFSKSPPPPDPRSCSHAGNEYLSDLHTIPQAPSPAGLAARLVEAARWRC